jgi:hypothetical protein
MRGPGRRLTVAAGSAALSLLSLKYLPLPYVWVCAIFASACVLAMRWSRRPVARVVWLNAGAVYLALGGVELISYKQAMRVERNAVHYPPGYLLRDDDLGTVPAKGTSVRVRRLYDDAPVYDVVYSIDANGLRKSPPDRGAGAKRCALFFSDSFVFGEGVSDEEAMPYRVGILTNGDVHVYNFSFHGYGAHQMLAALEGNRVDSTIHCHPTNVVFEALTDHVPRAAGLREYGRHGPRYELIRDGSGGEALRRVGHFDDDDRPLSFWADEIRSQASKSYYYRSLRAQSETGSDDDVRRYVAIVVAAGRLVEQRYPGCRFDVLLWQPHDGRPASDRLYAQIHEALLKAGVRLHLVSDVLPGFQRDASPYELRYDGHPNAHADDLLARYVAGTILRPQE